ncbi:hypothetical protein OUZ56_028071 [Daphnia magna]|uniref:Reelin domain-containing protein n=1 Tax=Daphnia magna TaxID=35525 RepID=A0ABR0B2S8_9CRUS|nr:hypothetical protein OUZ56_028071 [Daphnia magna]
MAHKNLNTFLLLYKTKIQSLVYGTPVENCRSMIPQHDYNLPQWMDPPPYNLSASVILSNTTTTQFNVTLFAKHGATFKGFFIQARSLTGDRADAILGSFDPVEDSRIAHLINCPDGANNAATHNLNSPKRFVTFVWNPPADFEGKFYFVATVVAEYKKFWIGIETPAFSIKEHQTEDAGHI